MAKRRKQQPIILGAPRATHEQRAIDSVQRSDRDRRRAYQAATCPAAISALMESTRANAQARSHLTSIGPHDSNRTRKLWGVVGRQGKEIDRALKSMERSGCINQHPSR